MTATPHKPGLNVHWNVDLTMSPFLSPGRTSDASFASTGSVQFLNAQLIAHGFTSAPGICLDGLSTGDSERVVKCMLGMLNQRVEDMGRAEQFSTNLRTLSYDHERLQSMHRAATEKAAFAEKEATLHKSRLAASTRALQTATTSLKNTIHELQRTRTSLQALRLTHASELKRKERDMEKMIEKWSRLAEVQSKLQVTPSGLTMSCANAGVVDGVAFGGGEGYLDIALREAEKSRAGLAEANARLRGLLLRSVNELQSAMSLVRSLPSPTPTGDEEALFTQTTLFPLAAPEFVFAEETISALVSSLTEGIETLARKTLSVSSTTSPADITPPKSDHCSSTTQVETTRLQETIDILQSELELAHQMNAQRTQALFDQFASDSRLQANAAEAEMSVELMTVPARDAELQLLESLRQQMNAERERFTEAAVKLGKDRAKLEADKAKLLAEKREWQVEMMLADLPATPAIPGSSSSPAPPKTRKSPSRKPASGRKAKVSRRSSFGIPSPSWGKVEASYETEVIPPPGPGLFGPLLPTTFTLPPPSPFSSLPTQPVVLSLEPSIPEEASRDPTPSPSSPAQPSTTPTDPPPQTPPGPTRRPFPVAKPYAQHMVHAYSPVKPSPLSRILMLSDSPVESGEGSTRGRAGLGEEVEEEMFPPVETLPPVRSLAAELGISEGDGETPFVAPSAGAAQSKVQSQVRLKPNSLSVKGKARAVPQEKENDAKRKVGPPAVNKSTARPSVATSKSRVAGRALPGVKGGMARRVPVDGGWKA